VLVVERRQLVLGLDLVQGRPRALERAVY